MRVHSLSKCSNPNQHSSQDFQRSVLSSTGMKACLKRPSRQLSRAKRIRQSTSQQLDLQRNRLEQQQLHQQVVVAVRVGDHVQAIGILDQLVNLYPDNATYYNNRGLLHFQNGQLERALADYDTAIYLNPKLANVYNNRANYYCTQSRLQEAIADYDTAIDLNPGNLRAWLNQGITYRDLGLYDRALENFDFILEWGLQVHTSAQETVDRAFWEGHVYAERGRIHHLTGDWNWAIADYQQALTRLPQNSLLELKPDSRLRLQVETWLGNLLRARLPHNKAD